MLANLKTADTPLSHAFRHIEPRWRNYIYYADLAAKDGDEAMKKYLASYNALPTSERNSVMPESVCDLAGVSAGDLIASVSKYLWQQKQGESTISASIHHPRVIESMAKAAQSTMYGYKDRELFLRATGTLPDKKGASIVINNTPQTANVNLPSSAGMSGFKPMDQSVIEMSRLLDEPAEAINIAAESDEDAELVFEDTD